MRFLSRIQRLTTVVSLHGYCPSVGLDDCLLPRAIRNYAHDIVRQKVEQYQTGIHSETESYAQRDNVGQLHSPLIYCLNNELSQDTEVDHLVQLRVDSESFITKHTLGQRTRHTRSSGASSERLNQIALLAMLATKGSVTVCMMVSVHTMSSNLIQCSHSLGQQFRWFD